ncbi:MAG: DUF305 domain-containing protein [Rickettsiales bacterium]
MRYFLILAALMLPVSAHAGDHSHKHHAMGKVSAKLKRDPAVKAYVKAAKVMHRDMDITYTGNADVDFTRGMLPHHQGAVDMIKVLHQYGKDEELRELANFMSRWQQVEINLMKRWLETKDSTAIVGNNEEAVAAYKESMHKMHKDMDITYTGDVDVDFANGMIPHHQGAIDMAWILIKHGKDEELRSMARDIIRSQQQEIAIMKEWLRKHGK